MLATNARWMDGAGCPRSPVGESQLAAKCSGTIAVVPEAVSADRKPLAVVVDFGGGWLVERRGRYAGCVDGAYVAVGTASFHACGQTRKRHEVTRGEARRHSVGMGNRRAVADNYAAGTRAAFAFYAPGSGACVVEAVVDPVSNTERRGGEDRRHRLTRTAQGRWLLALRLASYTDAHPALGVQSSWAHCHRRYDPPPPLPPLPRAAQTAQGKQEEDRRSARFGSRMCTLACALREQREHHLCPRPHRGGMAETRRGGEGPGVRGGEQLGGSR